MGYHRAGFDPVGVDIRPQPRYPFPFVQAEALDYLRSLTWVELMQYAAIHASPPCQAYSVSTRDRDSHPDLVDATRAALEETCLPWIMENVPGAPMPHAVTVCGSGLGLKVRRHRLFESSVALLVPPCVHVSQGQPVGVYGGGTGRGQTRGRKAMSADERRDVMGMPWATGAECAQAVHPAYTELLGSQMLSPPSLTEPPNV